MNTADLLPVITDVAENLAFLLPMGTCDLPPQADRAVCAKLGYADFDSGVIGSLYLVLTRHAAESAARGMLGKLEGEDLSDEDLRDTAGELANVLLGNLLPRHYGDTSEFHLGCPEPITADEITAAEWIGLDLGDGVMAVALVEEARVG